MDRDQALLDTEDTVVPVPVRRVSWASVFAGVVTTLAVQLVLTMIGVSVGASTIDPLSEAAPMRGLGVGSGIWLALSGLLALFAGGWVAGRLAGNPRRTDSALHGMLSWGLATLVTAIVVTSGAGRALSGVTGLVGRGLAALGQGAGAAAKTLAEQGAEKVREQGLDLSDLKAQAFQLLRDTGKPELAPENLGATGERSLQDAQSSAQKAAQNPEQARTEVAQLIDRLGANAGQALNAADREAAVNVLVNRAGMSREQADQTISQWQRTAQDAQAKIQQVRQQGEQKAREIGDKVAAGVARAAGWAALALILGAFAAVFGGLLGTPREAGTTVGFTRRRLVT